MGRFRRKVGEEEIKGQRHSRNMRLVWVTDGLLFLGEDLVKEAVIISEEIVRHCIKAVAKLDGSAQ